MNATISTGEMIVSYPDEPENYSVMRSAIEGLMSRFNVLKKDFDIISGAGIILEQFQERSTEIKGELAQIIYTLGEMYGYCLADDINQNVHQVK